MVFKVRDLLVTVLPYDGGKVCACTNESTDCDAGCSNANSDFYSGECGTIRENPADLVRELRTALQHSVVLAEAAELKARMQPKTAADVKLLEARIEKAIEDVEMIEKKLPRRGTGNALHTPFRISDLMITVLPEHGIADCDGGCSVTCDAGSGCPGGCSNGDSGCTNNSGNIELDPRDWRELVELRTVLEQSLARLHGKTNPVKSGPANQVEAEVLKKRLHAALAALKETKVDTVIKR